MSVINVDNAVRPQSFDFLKKISYLADSRPFDIALKQVDRGQIKVWRWADIRKEVDILYAYLKNRGLSAGSHLLLSGLYQDELLFVALAAQYEQARISLFSHHKSQEELIACLSERRPDFAYIQSRELVTGFIEYPLTNTIPLTIISPVLSSFSINAWQLTASTDAYSSDVSAEKHDVFYRDSQQHLWVEDGTQWQDGLNQILEHWIIQENTLCLPETVLSTHRDRNRIAPEKLLLSASSLDRLQRELKQRLPESGSLTRKITDRALVGNSRNPLLRWIKHRVDKQFGLSRVSQIISDTASHDLTSSLANDAVSRQEAA